MNRFAFHISSYALKAFSPFSKAKIKIHGEENIPAAGSVIFTPNHFTRMETIFLPHHIHALTKKPVWSLAAPELFQNDLFRQLLTALGAVSTEDPDRHHLITKNLISGETVWVIFPEGMMVKNKKLITHDHFEISKDNQIIRPHTGAATTALRCEFYRERLRRTKEKNPSEFKRLTGHFDITDSQKVLDLKTFIVPVNITYYPISAKENILSRMAMKILETPSKRMLDELMTEGTMLLSGVDVDIRFGPPLDIRDWLFNPFVESDLSSRRRMDFDRNICARPVMKAASAEIMKRFLSATYAMTTINYDHLLAGILKHLPAGQPGEPEYLLKCRLFLAAVHMAAQKENFIHEDLYDNPIHLLTDDRFGKIRDFLDTACETQVIQIFENTIYRNDEKLSAPASFHSIRIENPVAVMANELEPLKNMETYLKDLAETDGGKIKEAVRRHLYQKAFKEFQADLDRYCPHAEENGRKKGAPLFLHAPHQKTGVLLIHGYMASPLEMKGLAQYLHERSFTVYAPRLKGHGTAPEDLAETEYSQWIESVEEGYVLLKLTCETVFVGGFSTGAGLALELCSRVEGIEAAFAVAPPMKLGDLGAHFVPAVDLFNRLLKRARLQRMAKEFVQNRPENPEINYKRNPIAGIHQLEKLMKDLEPKLPGLTLPVLVAQARKDPVVNPAGTYRLFNSIGAVTKEYFLFDYDRHGILLGKNAERVYKSIDAFIRQWGAPPEGEPSDKA